MICRREVVVNKKLKVKNMGKGGGTLDREVDKTEGGKCEGGSWKEMMETESDAFLKKNEGGSGKRDMEGKRW